MIFHSYGLLIGLGGVFVYFYSKRNKRSFNLTERNVDISFLISLPLGLIFSRIYHVLSNLSYYFSHPLEILSVWNGGLGIFGLILGALVGLFLSSKILKIRLLDLLNLFFPPILIAQAIGRIGNFVNQEGFGPNRFPTFFLESILCLTAFLFFHFNKKLRNSGFTYYLISYGIIRFFTEFYRTDTWKIGNFHIAHILSVFIIIAGILFSGKKCSQHD